MADQAGLAKQGDESFAEATHCGTYIKLINDELERRANRTLALKGLTVVQWRVLVVLSEAAGGQLSFKELERLLNVSQAATAGIIHRMEEKGLVAARADANDKRVKHVRITPTGTKACEASRTDADQADAIFTNALTPAQFDTFVALLQTISASIVPNDDN